MKSQLIPILFNLVAALFGAGGQYLYQVGAKQLSDVPLWKNWPLFAGMLMFIVVMLLFVASFRLGGRLSVVYPVYATTFIWGALIAGLVVGEAIGLLQMVGIAVIVLGVSLVALGAH